MARYLRRRLPPEVADEFEVHFLDCPECVGELELARWIMSGLGESVLRRRMCDDVAVLEFTSPVRLIRSSRATYELYCTIAEQKDPKILVDLSEVNSIDSAGIGMLISCYTEAVRNHGTLKLLRPSQKVVDVLEIARTKELVETYDDELKALQSF